MGHIRQYCAKTIVVKAQGSSSNGSQTRNNGQEESTVYLVELERNNLLGVASLWPITKFRPLLSTTGPLKLAIDQKWSELANRRGVVFHQDNDSARTSITANQKL
ncbi:hypothetical protein TNCV_3932681 [Trichonephila clavipes]|nr:hypothetical protein TNCV_3932681 [Trichonephila clavipes]